MNDRMKAAEYLFDELGLISDSIVAEAMLVSIPAAGRKKISLRRAVSAIAAAAVIITLSLGVFAVGLMRDKNEAEDGVTELEAQSLEELLVGAQSGGVVRVHSSAEAVGLFDGQTKLIWQSESDGEYYSLTLTRNDDVARLNGALRNTYAEAKSVESGEVPDIRVWISYGDGKVVSPYLKKSEGNVGYGELFGYSPEILPSEELTELTRDLISE
ncbi:MAG: hypothetical protein IJV72_03660 [Clostridia bacterium]|nr:hypothetical protein [Clostridia bacterium]